MQKEKDEVSFKQDFQGDVQETTGINQYQSLSVISRVKMKDQQERQPLF